MDITAKGRATLQKYTEQREQWLAEAMAETLSPTERELLRLARRCVSPFEDGEESSYTQAEALDDLEEWLRERIERR